jgi:HEAT repeat protein
LPFLIEALDSSSRYIRYNSGLVLRRFIRAQGYFIFDAYGTTRDIVKKINIAVGEEEEPQTVEEILSELKSDNTRVKRQALYKLERVQPPTEEIVRNIIAVMRDEDEPTANLAEMVLHSPGICLNDAFAPVFREYLNDENSDIRFLALIYLEEHKALSWDRIVKVYSGLLKDENPRTRRAAADNLANHALNYPKETVSVIPALIEALGDDDFDVFEGVAEALGCFGELASDAIPKLERFTWEKDELRYDKAQFAIKKIKGEF